MTVSLALTFSILFLFILASFGPGINFPDVSAFSYLTRDVNLPDTPPALTSLYGIQDCAEPHASVSRDIWRKSKKKYDGLIDDKFTVAIQTYKRPERLNDTIHLLIDNEIPSLHEIVVVWNDLDEQPPKDFTAANGVGVRYRMSRVNSLNEKLWPDPEYRTKAILLSDDDVHYHPNDLDFVFQTWRHQQGRLTGAFGRCVVQKEERWEYSFCGKRDPYALVLTGLTFVHISLMDYYSSTDPLMESVRDMVDERFNCEDIAMNYVASMLTCLGPLQVSGFDKAVNTAPPQGISTKPGHLEARHECLNKFTDMFGHMPLKNSTEHVARGLLIG